MKRAAPRFPAFRLLTVGLLIGGLSVALWLAAHRSGWTLPADTVAVVDGVRLSLGEFERHLGRPAVFNNPDEVRRALEDFVTLKVLQREAEHSSARLGRRLDVAALVTHEVQARGGPSPVTEDALRAAYEARRAEFVHPERVRVAYFRVAGTDGPEAESQAAVLYRQAQMSASRAEFANLVEVGGQRPGVRSGETSLLPCDNPPGDELPADVVTRACRLRLNHLDGPFEYAGEWFVIRRSAMERARSWSFASVRQQLADELKKDAEWESREAVIRDFRGRAAVLIPATVIQRLVVPVRPVQSTGLSVPRPPGLGEGENL